MSNWHPKPLRKSDPNPLFPVEEGEVTIKGLSPIESQRAKDGSPVTATRPSALQPPDLELPLKKGSLMEDSGTKKKDSVRTEPSMSPSAVVKAFLKY